MTDTTNNGAESFMVMYGSQTFKHTSSKVTTHVFKPGGPIQFTNYLNNVMVAVRGTSAKVPAASGDHGNDHGQWYRQSYTFEEGRIIGFKFYSTINGGVRAHSIRMVRLRADGPYIAVKANLTPAPKATFVKLPVFTGRADVISAEEARKFGIQISRQMVNNLMDEEELEEDFEIEVIDPGTPKPVYEVVENTSGEKQVIVKPKSNRRIRVRR
jgi:hypothetical protein